MKKILLNIILCFLVIITVNPMLTYAAEDCGVEVSFTTNKKEYEADDEIQATLKIKNPNDYALDNVTAIFDTPTGYVVKEHDKVPTGVRLEGNSKETFKITFAQAGSEMASQEKTSNWWLWIVVPFVLIVLVIVGILFYKKRIRVISSLVIICIVGELLSPLNVQAAELQRYKTEVAADIMIAGEAKEIKVNLLFDCDVVESEIRIKTSEFGYSSENNAYTIYENLTAISGWLDNAKKYSEITLYVYDYNGKLIVEETKNATKEWTFENVGLFPGKNYIEVKAFGKKEVSAGLYLLDVFGSNYYELENAEVDTDGDGLPDLIELSLNTNVKEKDTDKDGLTDYQEVNELLTDPLLVDTDKDGISDFNEDYDGDGIVNGEEYVLGISPTCKDTDFDGILDAEEIYQYFTSANKNDTDDDGATDFWEINNGYDPLVFNDNFNVTASSNVVSDVIPVSLKVDANVANDNADVGSMSVEKVYSFDNPYITPTIVGYLGDAYEITLNGDIEEATLTFNYDTSLGNIGEDFQPRIYYFNEESKQFEELEDQVVNNGQVTAKTTHFSIYALLNKFKVDAAKNTSKEIKEEGKGNFQTSLLFAMDRSASMCTEENNGLGEEIVEYFISTMRDGYDQASVMTFTKKTELLSEFTKDKQALTNLVSEISYDNGVSQNSGTDGTKALYDAVEMVGSSKDGCRYVIFISDGDDNSQSYSYEEIIGKANEKDITIHIINIGQVNKAEFENVAVQTGGNYIEIGTNTDISKVLGDVSGKILKETTDSNNDGISDYYSELICQGKILLSNGSTELKGRDLNYDEDGNLTDDCDGDGLKNGEEIEIVYGEENIYIQMTSNPFQKHSDGDGISDYDEVKNGSDPLMYSLKKENVKFLTKGDYYEADRDYEIYKSNLDAQLRTYISSGLFGVWNIEEVYRDLMIEYFCQYISEEALQQAKEEEQQRLWVETINQWLATANQWESTANDTYSGIKDIYDLKDRVNQLGTSAAVQSTFEKDITNFILKNNKISGDATKLRFDCHGLEYTKKLYEEADVKKNVAKGVEITDTAFVVASGSLDVIDTIANIAKVDANSKTLKQNIDILDYIIEYSEDDYAKKAAKLLRNQLAINYIDEVVKIMDSKTSLEDDLKEISNNYSNYIKKTVEVRDTISAANNDLKELKAEVALSALAAENIYLLVAVSVLKTTDTLFGISQDVQQRFELLCYHEITVAAVALAEETIAVNGKEYYEIKQEQVSNMYRYLTHIAQLRILGETKLYQWMYHEGWLGFIGNNLQDIPTVKERINERLSELQLLIDQMNLKVSKNIKYSL